MYSNGERGERIRPFPFRSDAIFPVFSCDTVTLSNTYSEKRVPTASKVWFTVSRGLIYYKVLRTPVLNSTFYI